ncbi:hypothetical protein GOP47_0007134 [Adiantum capillus-veneris]|uniref:WRKY domain-containing protein n=1 Tax=Adiantum capillus-veneris TaxID=13818 RepID=A0A9D4V041_ADICA|nr:hypothetical protein GOP47_0007134 [Adiantum capillus-veneris]
MDHSYVALDVDTVVKSGPTAATPLLHNSSHIDSLLIKPTINSTNMQHFHASSGFYIERNVKCDEITSDMFSRTATAVQLYDRLQLVDMVRYSALGGVEFRGLRSMPVPSCIPAFDVKDYITSSNSFNFLASSSPSDIEAQMSTSTSRNGLGMMHHEKAGHVNAKPHINSMVVTSSLTGFPKGNMMEKQALEPNQSFSSKSMGPSINADNAKKVGSYASDCVSASHQLHIVPSEYHLFPDILARPYADSPNSPNSPSKQDSVLSAEDLDPDLQKAASQVQTSKRRKTHQQKRTVCIPVGDAKHNLKGETPPSDMWAWRKYGQKPIKGSPYPRGYYRCSSSKGCSARKQVERSCTDPTMLIVTYTSDHNHDWPVTKSSSLNAPFLTSSSPPLSKDKLGAEEHPAEEVATTTKSSCETAINESLFSSIVNSVTSVDDQVVSSLDVALQHDEESFSLKRDVDLCFLSRTSTAAEEDGVFDDLGELPELSSIFSKGYLEDHQQYDVGDGWLVH